MCLILKSDAFDNFSVNDLLHVNLMDKCIYLKRKDIHLGFETGQILQDLIVKSVVSMSTASEFSKECRKAINYILPKVLEKIPLGSSLLGNSTVLDPQSIVLISKDSLRGKIKTLLHHLVALEIISHTISEKAFLQYTEELHPKVKEIGVFDQMKERLGKFFFQNPNFLLPSEIQSVINLVLVLSHDQTSIERGFNISKSLLKSTSVIIQ